MNRELLLKELIDSQRDWVFAGLLYQPKFRSGKSPTDDEINNPPDKVGQWFKNAPEEWLSLAVDLINQPPSSRELHAFKLGSRDHPRDEFLISMEHRLGVWYRYHPQWWIQAMTPMLNNQVTRAKTARYSSARLMALQLAALAGYHSPISLIAPLVEWLAPLWREPDVLTRKEKNTYNTVVLSLFNWYALPHCDYYLSLNSKEPLVLLGSWPHLSFTKQEEDSDIEDDDTEEYAMAAT